MQVLFYEAQHHGCGGHGALFRLHEYGFDYLLHADWLDWIFRVPMVCAQNLRGYQSGLSRDFVISMQFLL